MIPTNQKLLNEKPVYYTPAQVQERIILSDHIQSYFVLHNDGYLTRASIIVYDLGTLVNGSTEWLDYFMNLTPMTEFEVIGDEQDIREKARELSVLTPKFYRRGFGNMYQAMNNKGISFLSFGKPEAHLNRRMGLILATADTVKEAKLNAKAYQELSKKHKEKRYNYFKQ